MVISYLTYISAMGGMCIYVVYIVIVKYVTKTLVVSIYI